MGDLVGLLPLPAPAPDLANTPGQGPVGNNPNARGAVTDPLLYVLGDFMKALWTDKLTTAWQTQITVDSRTVGVAPNVPIVNKVNLWDPRPRKSLAGYFAEQDLPALFLWRDSFEPTKWLAHDIFLLPSKVGFFWIPPRTEQSIRMMRDPIINGLYASIALALEQFYGDADWQDPLDNSSPLVATEGSVVPVRLGVYQIDIGRVQRDVLSIPPVEGGPAQEYPGVFGTFDVLEKTTPDPTTRYSVMSGVSGTAYNNELNQDGTRVPMAMVSFDFRLTVQSSTPNTGTHLGGTAITIMGTDIVPGAAITIGGAPVTGQTFLGPNIVTCTTPAGTVGAKDIVITNPGGEQATLANGFTFT